MERNTTTVDLLAPWMKTLEAFSEPLSTAMATGTTPPTPTMNMWNTAIESWKTAIYGSLEAQLAWAQMCKDWTCCTTNIPEAKLGACCALHFLEDWTRAQMRIWDIWSATMEGHTPVAK